MPIVGKIGPYLYIKDSQDPDSTYNLFKKLNEVADDMQELDNNKRSIGGSFVFVLTRLWFFVFLFNPLNITAIILMINTTLPINFYYYLR